jgi:hypothetical protein
MNVEFKCHTCGGGGKNEFRDIVDFTVSAYEDVLEWSDCTDEIPQLNDYKWWLRSEETPRKDEYRVVSVRHPFNEKLKGTFWTLFLPACSSINGWQDHPDEIDISAFVKCKLDKVLHHGENQAWLRIEVVECIKLSEAVNVLPEVKESLPIVENTYQFDTFDRETLSGWKYYSGSAQGDLGNWMLVKEDKELAKLVAFGEWSFHKHCAYLGNILISSKTLETLNKWCGNV